VADVEPPRAPMERPWQVSRAMILLWISMGANLVNSWWGSVRPVLQLEGPSRVFTLAIFVISFLLIAGLYYTTGKGRNWARVLILIYVCVSVPLVFYQLMFGLGAIVGGVALLTTCMKLYAGYLLLTAPAREWFLGMKGRP
jgi:hypothetical protein